MYLAGVRSGTWSGPGPKTPFSSKTSKTSKTRFGNPTWQVVTQGPKTTFFDIRVCQVCTRTLPGPCPPLRSLQFCNGPTHRLFPTFSVSPRPTFWRQKTRPERCNPVVQTGAFQWKKRRNFSGSLDVIFSAKKQGSAQAYSDGV